MDYSRKNQGEDIEFPGVYRMWRFQGSIKNRNGKKRGDSVFSFMNFQLASKLARFFLAIWQVMVYYAIAVK